MLVIRDLLEKPPNIVGTNAGALVYNLFNYFQSWDYPSLSHGWFRCSGKALGSVLLWVTKNKKLASNMLMIEMGL
jgi:hypothetical protein